MAQVPATSYESTSLGDVAEFTIPFPFLSRAEVFVTVDGAQSAFTWINDGLIQLPEIPELGAVVRRYRSTAAYVPLHQFSQGVPFLPRYVDRDFTQTLYAVQESVNDTAGTAALALDTAELALDTAQSALDLVAERTQYMVLGPYGPGLHFQTTSQVFSYLGEFYAPGPSIALPYTTTGVGAAEIANFRSVGDAILRSDLAEDSDPLNGAGLIGYDGSTVAAELDSLKAVSQKVRTTNESPFVVDMHWGVLLGTGWTAGDPPFNPGVDPINVVTTNATAAVSAGGTDIPVTTTTGFTAGMLLCYVATDGLYYPFRLFSVLAGPILRADRSLPVGIANGGCIHNFYRDDAHPNDKGGATIVDAALLQLRNPTTGRTRELEFLARDAAIWNTLGATTITSLTSADYSTLGSAAIGERATQVSGSAVDTGVESQYVGLIGGDYIAKLPVNVGNRTGGFTGSVNVVIRERRQSGQIYSIATSGLLTGYDGNFNVEVPFSSAPGSAVSVWVISPQYGPWVFNVGALEFHRLGDRALEVNRGKHVLLGDSWFSHGSPFATAFVARMNNATVAVKGVSGNKADQLIARFSADVTPENPDYVWVMVGTNDYYAGKDWSIFEQEIHQLRRMIQAIGAQPIFFTPSVGAVTYVPQQLHPSRRYALNVRYFPGGATMPDGSNTVWRNAQINVQALSVAAGATVTVFTVPGLTRKEAVLRFLSTTTASINVRFEYAASPDGSGGVEPTIFATAAVQREKLLPRVSDVALRFPCMRLHNPTGGAVVVSLVADIAWAQDLV